MTSETTTQDGPPLKRPRRRPPEAAAALEKARDLARNRICEAALLLFERGGIEAISMRQIANEIGVSQMMAYNYFRTKDHLLQELRTRAFQQLEQVLTASARIDGTARERLRQVLLAYVRFGLQERRAYRLMFDYWAYDNPERMLQDFGDAARRQAGPWNALLAAVSAFVVEDGGDADPLTATHLVWAGLHGLVSLEVSRKLVWGRTAEQLETPMVDVILGGILPPQR